MAFSSILVDYLGEGIAADRPATPPISPTALAFYYSTDTTLLELWNGSAWVHASAAGTVTSISTGTGLTGGPITNTGTVSLAAIAAGDLLANTTTASAAPIPTTLSALLDNSAGSTQGDIIFRNGTSWVALPPGTSGQVLETGGPGADPSWQPAPATGVSSVVAGTGLAGGTITSTGTISLAAIAAGDLLANTTGSPAAPVATTLTGLIDNAIGSIQGDILFRSSTAWTVLAPGTSGNVLATQGAGADPHWIPVATGGGTVTSISTGSGLSGGPITTAGTIVANWNGGTVSALGSTLTLSSGTIGVNNTLSITGPLTVNANAAPAIAGPAGTEVQVVGADGVASRILLDAFNAPATWTTRRAGGTGASPTALPINTAIATYNAIGHQGTTYSAGHLFMTVVTGEAWTPTAQGHYITFNTAANGGTVVAEAMRLNTTGNLLLGTTTDDGVNKMQVTGGVKVSGHGIFGATAVTDPFIVNSGTATPKTPAAQSILQFTGDSGGIRVEVDAYGGTPQFTGARASGTQASPSAVTVNSSLFSVNGFGFGATVWSTVVRGSISITAAETWTDTAQGSYIAFNVTTIGGTTTAEKMRLSDSGHLLIGTTTDDGTNFLQVNGPAKATTLRASSMPTSDPAVAGELWVTTSGAVASSGTAPALPLTFVIAGKPGASQVYNVPMGIAASLNANFAGTVVYDTTLTTANAVFTVNKISGGTTTAIGTLTITNASHTSVTLSTQAAVAFAIGDVVQLVAPSSQDATLADIGITLLATKV